YRSGTQATYTCKANFAFDSTTTSSILTCGSSVAGAWNPTTAPQCKAVCNPAPSAFDSNGNDPTYAPALITGTTTYKSGTQATYTCKANFDFDTTTSPILTCGSSVAGAWNPTTAPQCKAVCSAPPSPSTNSAGPTFNPTQPGPFYKSGTTAAYTCTSPAIFVSGAVTISLTCTTGAWNPNAAPTCTVVCSDAPTPNANTNAPTYSTTAIVSGGNKYTVGTVATYTCSGARGFTGTFEELYKKKLTCLSTGAWSSSTAPECVT
uniref:Sushi domain-containing protein n=1 Tax=Ciona savignyi TaxID=51511 RepID=H2Z603_CIOSA